MSVFRFKQFDVVQQDSAMKVGTDSVLLGSLLQASSPLSILDIGTGTGLLALMMAQRFPEAMIDAVEIEEKAFAEARHNADQSSFANRVNVHHQSVQEYAALTQHTYNLIVSNPPYYETENSFSIQVENRSHARHTVSLSFDALLKSISKLLSEEGKCWMILPTMEAERVMTKAEQSGLHSIHQIAVYPNPKKASNRTIFCLTKSRTQNIRETFVIKNEQGVYTDSYREETGPFLLWNS
jgi:tRNA1Val (adenine37-N6)-methyltransferase